MLWWILACTGPEPDAPPEPEIVPTAPTVPLEDAVTLDALLGHLDALQDIADINDATRVFSSQGFLDSATYVEDLLVDAGYAVESQPFDVTAYEVFSIEVDPAPPDGLGVLAYSASGDVTASVVSVDSAIGCESSDFDFFPAGSIALIQRGTCTFAEKVALAAQAGAVGVLIFNDGEPGRTDVVEGVLTNGVLSDVPALGLSYADGMAMLTNAAPIRLVVDAELTVTTDHNLVAETAGGDPDSVLLVGAHLDSVAAGPGINDNGSGSALVLEVALQMAAQDLRPEHQVRFVWWGAEELGLIGSNRYVYTESGDVDQERMDGLFATLNFDMLASGDGARFVYDGDNSEIMDGGGSDGSGEIEGIFLDWFAAMDQETMPDTMWAASDSFFFVAAGVPTGGLFSGAFGPGAGAPDWDACYHQSCDRTENIDPGLYEDLSRGAAHAIEALAMRTEPLGPGAQFRSAPPRDPPSGCHSDPVVVR